MGSSILHLAMRARGFPGHTSSGNGKARNRMRAPFYCPCVCQLTMHRYWMFLAYFIAGLACVHIFLPPIARSESYINLLGYVGLAVEATLPVPQILANHRSRSCKGFRLSVCAAWIIGDTMKMSYFFFSQDVIPWAFKLCGMFQCVCDFYLGVQFWMYTRGSRVAGNSRGNSEGLEEEKDIRMT